MGPGTGDVDPAHRGLVPGYDDYLQLRGVNYLAAYTDLYRSDHDNAVGAALAQAPCTER